MGLLSSSSAIGEESFIHRTIRKFGYLLSIAAYCCGVIYLLVLLWPAFNDRTYFSENALLPGLVDEELKSVHTFSQLQQGLKSADQQLDRSKQQMPIQWIENQLVSFGLEAYVQNYTVVSPLAGKEPLRGNNVYGVLRAPRSISAEGILLVIPYSSDNIAGASIAMAFAQHAAKKVYWAKDLIFLFSEFDTIGVQAWLAAYHEIPQSSIVFDSLDAHSGPLQAAIGLEWDGKDATHVDLKYNMVNGQLPNLDLINLAKRMIDKFGSTPSIYRMESPYQQYSQEGYLNALRMSLTGLAWQSSCKPNGVHGVFGQYGIEAVTINPWRSASPGRHYASKAIDIAQMVEGMFRSINNLLEHFHQSFFFYFLPTTERYISIGKYIPASGLIIFASVSKAITIWLNMKLPDADDDVTDAKLIEAKLVAQSTGFAGSLPLVLLSHLIGVTIYHLPVMIETLSIPEMDASNNLLAGACGLLCALLVFPRLFVRKNGPKFINVEWLRVICLLEFALILGVMSVLNFGLAFLIGVIWTPVFLLVKPGRGSCSSMFIALLLLIVNPFCILIASQVLTVIWQLITRGYPLTMEYVGLKIIEQLKLTLTGIVMDSYIYNSWLLSFVTLWAIPVWTLFWTMNFL